LFGRRESCIVRYELAVMALGMGLMVGEAFKRAGYNLGGILAGREIWRWHIASTMFSAITVVLLQVCTNLEFSAMTVLSSQILIISNMYENT
jgi:hypothetical protein